MTVLAWMNNEKHKMIFGLTEFAQVFDPSSYIF